MSWPFPSGTEQVSNGLAAYNLFRKERGNGLEERTNSSVGIDCGVDLRVAPSCMKSKHFRPRMRFLHHVWKMVTVILSQSRAKDYQIERTPAQGFFYRLPIQGCFHLMSSLLDQRRVRVENGRIPFAVKDLQFER